jgi:rod shape determining protein RodA
MSLEKFLEHIRKMDWALIFFAVILTISGLVSIYSSSFAQGDFSNFWKQIFFLGLGFFLMVVFSFLDWRVLKENPYLILTFYFLSLFALVFLLFFAPETRGTRGWFKVGSFSIDPIEPAKIILLLLLAKYFSSRHIEMYNTKHIFISGLYVLLPCFLIFFQPDLGSVLIFVLLWLGILIVSGIEIKHFLILMLIASLVFVFSWNRFLKEYQKQRILSFIAPHIEPLGIGWTSFQSKLAIGSGRILGKGWKLGSQVQLGFLTAPQTDFIFAAIAEEFGLLGTGVLLLLICLFFLRVIRIAFFAKTNFCRLFVAGFACLFGLQVFVHIGMNLGILPIIGISLPFVSYGGSGLILNFVGLGILQDLNVYKK